MAKRRTYGELNLDGVPYQITDVHAGALVRFPDEHLRVIGTITLAAPGEDDPQTLLADVTLTPMEAAPEKLRRIATGYTMSSSATGRSGACAAKLRPRSVLPEPGAITEAETRAQVTQDCAIHDAMGRDAASQLRHLHHTEGS